ncbi:MAG: hypothetical protein IKB34_00165 [Clostridia bacterium]|nr:hypothetical protein [Clostridia bacterium]
MENLVIFSSAPMCVVMGAILLLHVVSTLLPELDPRGTHFKEKSRGIQMAIWAVAILNAVLHFVLIGYAFIKSASPEEMLMAIMLSSAVAMVSIGIREKIGNIDGKEKNKKK